MDAKPQLSVESANAMRQCLQILAPLGTPAERAIWVRNVESYIQEGKWLPAFLLTHIPPLFFPHSRKRAEKMRQAMLDALESGELLSAGKNAAGIECFLPGHLAAWRACPTVPSGSPLRFWLQQLVPPEASVDEGGIVHRVICRDSPLKPQIEAARRRAVDANSVNEIWGLLKEDALNETPPFSGRVDSGGIEYTDGHNKIKWFKKKNLHDRLARLRNR